MALVTPLLAHIAGIPVEETLAQLGFVGVGAAGTVVMMLKARIRRRAQGARVSKSQSRASSTEKTLTS